MDGERGRLPPRGQHAGDVLVGPHHPHLGRHGRQGRRCRPCPPPPSPGRRPRAQELRKIHRSQHTAAITSLQWHPNGALIASTSADNTTCLWDASSGAKLRTLREHFGWVLSCSFAPDRTKLATCSWDKTVRLWDPNTGELISTLRGHTKGVWAASFYPVGHTSALLATAGEDCTARLWDTRSRKVALTLSGGHADAIYRCKFTSPDIAGSLWTDELFASEEGTAVTCPMPDATFPCESPPPAGRQRVPIISSPPQPRRRARLLPWSCTRAPR